jgi:hypothetical protein
VRKKFSWARKNDEHRRVTMKGYAGKLLRVDLSNGKVSKEEVAD